MIDTADMTEILGWCSIINVALLFLAFFMVTLFHDWIKKLHGKMFRLNENNIASIYFQYLGQYKLLILVFNIVPYFVLKLAI